MHPLIQQMLAEFCWVPGIIAVPGGTAVNKANNHLWSMPTLQKGKTKRNKELDLKRKFLPLKVLYPLCCPSQVEHRPVPKPLAALRAPQGLQGQLH